ncbi:hypothetical protein [Methanobrevibacter sp.]|uniref:hypothetical protein n=1 Tax=Methanobrevibacter sp. TaxID=66852 RepID=UPI003890AF74
MKLKNMIAILSVMFVLLLFIGGVSASETGDLIAEENDSNAPTNDAVYVNVNATSSDDGASNTTSADDNNATAATEGQPVEKTDAMLTGNTIFTKKSNKYFSLGVATFDEGKNKLVFHKNVKLIVKVKVGKKTTTYNVKTNKKGIAKIFNVKNLKVGTYKVSVKDNDTKFNVKEKGKIAVYNNKVKTLTLKMNTYKKIKGDIMQTFVEPKDAQYKKGVYAECYNAKSPMDKLPHKIIVKAKFFFKNKKTGKVISKTYKSKTDIYGFYEPVSKLIKGYKPIKTKIYYCSM